MGSGKVRTLRIAGQVVRFAVSERREEERLGAVAADEGRMLRRLLASVREGDTFFDVGANIGTVTLPVAVTGAVECLAFEPEPGNAARLGENVELNGLVNVTVLEAAAWSAPGQLGLRGGGPVGSGTAAVEEDGADRALPVAAATIDQLTARGRSAPDVLKVDAEGAELEVLRGAAETLDGGRVRDVFVETHPLALAERGSSEAGVGALLERSGYSEVWSATRGSETHRHFRAG
jgi:FkbM family methyltransferase